MCLGLLILFLQAPGATPAPCPTPSPHHLNTKRRGLSAPTKPPLTPCPTLRCPPSCSTHGASLRAESPLGQRYPHHTPPCGAPPVWSPRPPFRARRPAPGAHCLPRSRSSSSASPSGSPPSLMAPPPLRRVTAAACMAAA